MTKWDKLLIVFIIIISISGLYIVKSGAFNNGTKYVIIEIDGEEYKKVSLGPNMAGETLEINSKFGHNTIEFDKDRVRVIDADCPDKLDVKQGWISNAGEVIVCLPNHLVIEIVTEGNNNTDFDYISH
ncbi:MAG: NusG domain II-containing protein [Firmicutes bacterium]|nr:NusG domain II-containing protein [Bacillota bacterium]